MFDVWMSKMSSSIIQKFGLAAPETRMGYEEIELSGRPLAKYDKASGAQKACITGLCFSVLIGAAFIAIGLYAKGSSRVYSLTPIAREFIPLSINFLVLIVTESLGYIHSISLRWALFYENRLDFNTNLRLLTFSKKSFPNGMLCNAVFFLCVAVCYATTPMILIQNTYQYYLTDGGIPFEEVAKLTSLSHAIPIALGVAILLQCCLAGWCILGSRIPSWSSDPLNTMAVGIVESLPHRNGRCMMSVHDRDKISAPQRPAARQQSAYAASPKVLWSLVAISLVFSILIILMGITIRVGYSNDIGKSWGFVPTATINTNTGVASSSVNNQTLSVYLQWFTEPIPDESGPNIIPERMMLGVLAFSILIQSFITIGLHCVELQVNLSRDESVWRTVASETGSIPDTFYNSTTMPLKSWQSLGLLVFKPVIHWLYGAAMQVDYATGIVIRVPHVTYLTILWAFLIGFAVLVGLNRPRGALPATYGHLRTMVDIVDEWSIKMYWGDKGEGQGEDGVRHAGTSDNPLPAINMNAFYAGSI
jgi:hypothetical protein